VNPAYVETLRNRLGAEVKEADFAKGGAEAAQKVNAWVGEATCGKIREIVSPSQVDPLTRLLLANAIYFKASWLYPFDEEATRPEPFRLLDRRLVDVPMIHVTALYSYVRDRSVQVLQVPYLGGRNVMLLLLPDEGKLEVVERELDTGRMDGLIRETEIVEANLALPRFRMESSFQLRSTLMKLGIAEAFSPRADFSGVSGEPGFALSEVLHKTWVDVDEWGTEAAAVTMETMFGAALERRRPIDFRVDRPFLFLIRDNPTATILFMGRVVDPSR